MTLKCLIRSLEQPWAQNVLPHTHACLTIGYQEKMKLFTKELPKYFSNEECLLIKLFFKRYMDDGFIFWQKYVDFNNNFSICLNHLHPEIKYTFEKAKLIVRNSEACQGIPYTYTIVP